MTLKHGQLLVEDLVKVFTDAKRAQELRLRAIPLEEYEKIEFPSTIENSAGIAAVVRAMGPVVENGFYAGWNEHRRGPKLGDNGDTGPQCAIRLINEILGNGDLDAPDRGMADGPTSNDGTELDRTSGQAPVTTTTADVCEWKHIVLTNHYSTAHGEERFWDYASNGPCITCGKKIRFVEAMR